MTLFLRRATFSDIDILYKWVNDSDVRKSAFNTKQISYEDHVSWFNRMMMNVDEAQYILMLDDNAIGQIRLSMTNNEAKIDYSISKTVRGHGYGKEIIRLLKSKIREDFPYD